MQTPAYSTASRELLEQATRELEAGDSRQASEKAWGAAAHMVKAVAEGRGWRHDNHFLLFQTVNRLAEEARDEQTIAPFQAASSLHTNFYENWQPAESVAAGKRSVATLLDKLEPLI